MSATCPDGHTTTASDWCDVCGLPMDGAPSQTPPAPGAAGAPDPAPSTPPQPPSPLPTGTVGTCPNCATPQMADDHFCEVCGLDFSTGDLPAAPAAPTAAATPDASTARGWSLAIAADRDWWTAQEAEAGRDVAFPVDAVGFTVVLDAPETTIGRRSERDGWYPDVDLGHTYDDPAVSRRHAQIHAGPDGPVLRDLGSTNGTNVNGEAVARDTDRPLADGDVIHIGAFTRITVTGPPDAPEQTS